MKKIITAINHPKLNEELRKEKNFEVIGRDIQYKEAILEILEKNKLIDIIIINEKIPGEMELEEMIEKIKKINQKIKIIFILEKENNELEKILIKNNIIDIYYNNEINLKELIKIINKKERNMEEEIIELKKIIEEKNNLEKNKKINKDKEKSFIKTYLNEIINNIKKIINKQENEVNILNNMSTKTITFSGNYKGGKSTLALIISHYLAEGKDKVLLLDGDMEKQDLSMVLRKNKKSIRRKSNGKNKYEIKKFNRGKIKKIYINKKRIKRNKKLINKKNKIKNYKIKNDIQLFTKKINKNLYFFDGLKYLLKNASLKNQKELINCFLKQIKEKYNFIIVDLAKNNIKILNKEIIKKSDINFVVMIADLLGIKEGEALLKIYLNEWKVNKNNLNIIINKKSFKSINKKIISNCLQIKNKIYEIKENKILSIFIFNYFKFKYLLNNKKLKKEINKIIKIK